MTTLNQTSSRDAKPVIVMHDRDAKFSKQFIEALEKQGVTTNSLPKATPNLNGRCEWFIGTIRWECLDKFIVFGKRHLDHLLGEFSAYYNTLRPHSSLGYRTPTAFAHECAATSVRPTATLQKPHTRPLVPLS